MTALPDVPPLDQCAQPALKARLDGLAKPSGSLGALEGLAVRLALIQGRPDPRAGRVVLLVFAGDHGLTQDGVSGYPASVTASMVRTLLAGRAVANAFACVVGAEVRVVDAGVDADFADDPRLHGAKVRRGTRNAAREAAMTAEEAHEAVQLGVRQASAAIDDGAEVLALGEMGIGNTASAALLMHRLAPAPLADCVGQGAGNHPDGLARKLAALRLAAARSDAAEPMEALRQFGGFEIAAMAGAVIGAAARRTPVLIDGFIATTAALVAVRLRPEAREACLFAHRSAEAGHIGLLHALDAEPLMDLGLRLGEGTGALLAVPLLRAAAALFTEVAALDDVLGGHS